MIKKKFMLSSTKIYNTNFYIPEEMLGKRVLAYNGRTFVSLLIRDDHLNKRIGDFIITKLQGYKIHKKKDKKKTKKK